MNKTIVLAVWIESKDRNGDEGPTAGNLTEHESRADAEKAVAKLWARGIEACAFENRDGAYVKLFVLQNEAGGPRLETRP